MYKLLLCWRYLRTRYIALVCIVSALTAAATGCVKFEHSLAESGELVVDDAIVGVWQLQYEVFPDQLEIVSLPDGEYRLFSPDAARGNSTDFVLVKAAEGTYIEPVRERVNGQVCSRESMPWAFPSRCERRGDWIAIDQLNLDVLRKLAENRQGIRAATVRSSLETLRITSTAADIETFLASHADEVFTTRRVYQRASTDNHETEVADDE